MFQLAARNLRSDTSRETVESVILTLYSHGLFASGGAAVTDLLWLGFHKHLASAFMALACYRHSVADFDALKQEVPPPFS